MRPYRVVLLVLFFPLLLRLFSGRAGKVTAFDWLMIGATLWAVLALLVNHEVARVIEPVGVIIIEFLGAYLLARICVRSAEDFRRVVRVLFGIILFLLVFAAIESVTNRPILMQLIQPSMITYQGARFGLRRAQTLFAHPIHYGAFVSAGLGLVWYAFRPDAGAASRVACALAIGLSTFFSLSTGALLAFVMQCVFIAWELAMRPDPRRWRLFAGLSVAGYIFIDLLSTRSPFHVLVNYATFSSGSAYNRILIWHFGTNNVADNPIFGIGLNPWVKPGWMSDSVDNFWLLLTMQYGLPFIAMFMGALFLILRRVSRQPLTDPVDRACRAGYLTTFGGVALAGGTVHYWQNMFVFVLFLFGMGIWICTGGARPGQAAPQDEPAPGRGQADRRGTVPHRKRSVL
jgi:hypothetical protein